MPLVRLSVVVALLAPGVARAEEPVGAPPAEPLALPVAPADEAAPIPPWVTPLGGDARAIVRGDGGRALVVTDGGLVLVDVETGQIVATQGGTYVAAAPAGDGFWACGPDGVVGIDADLGAVSAPITASCRALLSYEEGTCEVVFADTNDGLARLPERCVAPPPPPPRPPPVAVAGYGRRRVDLPKVLGLEVGTVHERFRLQGCEVTLGGGVGASWVALGWRTLGRSLAWSGSPTVGASCTFHGGRRVGWIVGVESSPWLRHVVDGVRYANGLVVTGALGVRSERTFVGAHLLGGISALGAGALVRSVPFERTSGARHGLEARFTTMFHDAFAGQLQVAWLVELGPRDR